VINISFAVNFIRSLFSLHENNRTVTASEFGCEIVSQNLEFFNRGKRSSLTILIFRRIIVIDAVDLKRRAARSRSVEVNGRT